MKFTHTDTGLRRTENEDRFWRRRNIFVVADGIGGHRKRRRGCAAAVDAFVAAIRAGQPGDEAARAANETMLFIEGAQLALPARPRRRSSSPKIARCWFHAGDSAWRIALASRS